MAADRAASLRRARARAERRYKSPDFRRTYIAGAAAALEGRPADSCPYRRSPTGWGRSWRAAWLNGFKSIAPKGTRT